MAEVRHILHPIPPLYDEHSRVLVLGSFPSVKSRQTAFFYGHPQNRFWKVLARVFADEGTDPCAAAVPETIEEKRRFLLAHRVAVWDVIASCDIAGSADSSIRDVVPNDLSVILNRAQIRQIFVNGKTAEKYFRRYIEPKIGRQAVCLPSTSPANAAFSVDRLACAWQAVREAAEF